MADSFDRWLEGSLRDQLASAYAVAPVPATARYRRELVVQSGGRGRPGLRSLTAGKLALLMAALLVLGTVGAEASGYGPIKVGHRGIYVQIGTPATPNPPVASPTSSPAPDVAAPTAAAPASPRAGEGEDATRTSSEPLASPTESPERETEGFTSPKPSLSPYATAEPGDH